MKFQFAGELSMILAARHESSGGCLLDCAKPPDIDRLSADTDLHLPSLPLLVPSRSLHANPVFRTGATIHGALRGGHTPEVFPRIKQLVLFVYPCDTSA